MVGWMKTEALSSSTLDGVWWPWDPTIRCYCSCKQRSSYCWSFNRRKGCSTTIWRIPALRPMQIRSLLAIIAKWRIIIIDKTSGGKSHTLRCQLYFWTCCIRSAQILCWNFYLAIDSYWFAYCKAQNWWAPMAIELQTIESVCWSFVLFKQSLLEWYELDLSWPEI